MELILTNSPQILTDDGKYIRINKIDYVYIDENSIVRAMVGGSPILLTDVLTPVEAQENLQIVLDAINKYDPVMNLAVRYSYSGGKVEYKGTHTLINPPVSDPDWVITKYSYTGNNLSLEQGPLVGSWDNRATLGW